MLRPAAALGADHSIVGVVPKQWWLSKLAADGDGVVSRAMPIWTAPPARCPSSPADHTTWHATRRRCSKVRRILLEHLAELEGRPVQSLAHRQPPVWPPQSQQ